MSSAFPTTAYSAWEIPSQPLNIGASRKPFTLYDCVRPVYIASRICGLLPFSISCDSNGRFQDARVGLFDALWFIGSIAINSTLIYFLIISIREHPLTIGFSILQVGSRILTISAYTLIIIAIILDMINRKRLINILQGLFSFDKSVRKKNSTIFLIN